MRGGQRCCAFVSCRRSFRSCSARVSLRYGARGVEAHGLTVSTFTITIPIDLPSLRLSHLRHRLSKAEPRPQNTTSLYPWYLPRSRGLFVPVPPTNTDLARRMRGIHLPLLLSGLLGLISSASCSPAFQQNCVATTLVAVWCGSIESPVHAPS